MRVLKWAVRGVRNRRAALEMMTIRLAGQLPIHRMRIAVLRMWGAQIGEGVTIYHGIEVRHPRGLAIGDRTSVGNDAILDARGGLTIGSDTNLSTGAHIWSAQHDWRGTDFSYTRAPVKIGNRVWLSARTTVLPGTGIGDCAVIAAGAVVSRDLESNGVYAGVPARKVGERPQGQAYHLPPATSKLWWW